MAAKSTNELENALKAAQQAGLKLHTEANSRKMELVECQDKLAERDHQLKVCKLELAKCKLEIAEKDRLLAKKDRLLAEKDEAIGEKARMIDELKTELKAAKEKPPIVGAVASPAGVVPGGAGVVTGGAAGGALSRKKQPLARVRSMSEGSPPFAIDYEGQVETGIFGTIFQLNDIKKRNCVVCTEFGKQKALKVNKLESKEKNVNYRPANLKTHILTEIHQEALEEFKINSKETAIAFIKNIKK